MKTILVFESWGDDKVVGIRSSNGKIIVSSSPAELLEFMRYSARDVIRATWDLDEFIAPVLRLLPKAILESLSRFDDNTEYEGHQLYYLPDRTVRIGRSRFYGLKQFWSTKEPAPVTLEDTQDKADELAGTLAVCGMPDFDRLTSPVSIFEQTELGRRVYAGIPKGYELNPSCYGALEFASKADKREWISNYQVGHWREGEIFDYDLSAAYPACASALLSLRDCEVWRASAMGRREMGAYYGFVKGRLYLDPKAEWVHCSPLMTDLERLPGNPAGDFGEDYSCTLDEVRFVERHNLGEFQLFDGWFLKPNSGIRPGTPFRDIMDYLYQKRSRSDLASTVMKGVANQLIGKLIETRVDGEYGELRNDIYHALVLAQARVKVAEFLIQNEVRADELVCVQTDGVRLTREIKLPTNGFGKWRCNGSQSTIVASPYKVYVGDKKPGHLTYECITEMIAGHPLSKYYGRTVKRRVTLRQALQEGDITKVGAMDDLPAHLDLVAIAREQSRVFAKLPQTGTSLLGGQYQSTPVVL